MSRKHILKNLAYDDEKGLYYAYFDLGTGIDGRRRRYSKTFYSEGEAVKALEQFRRGEGGGLHDMERVTLREWLDYWLEDVVRPNLEYTTYYCYKNIIKKHLEPALGELRLQELAPYRIQQYYTMMVREKGLSSNTVHKHHILLHTSLKLAFRQGVLLYNPVDRVEPPKEQPAQRQFYTPQQLKRLIQTVEGSSVELIVKLAGYLGLRRGEICGLRWKDVDLQSKVISIRRARTTAGTTVVEKAPKTGNSVRCLGIAELDDLIDLLKRTRQRQLGTGGHPAGNDGFVIAWEDGRPWHPNQVTKALSDVVRRESLPPITVHGLRHTFASVANSVHIPLPDISKALGHKDVVVTGRIYTHIFDQTHSEAVSAVARCIRGV